MSDTQSNAWKLIKRCRPYSYKTKRRSNPPKSHSDFVFSTIAAPYLYFVHQKCSVTSSFYSELQDIHSSSNWNVQIWIFKTPFYLVYTCSLIKYSTFSHYCIRRSMNGKHNRTIVIHNPLILSMTDKTKGES